jgi:hypothetical protein
MDDRAFVELAVKGVIVAYDHGEVEDDANANVGVGGNNFFHITFQEIHFVFFV